MINPATFKPYFDQSNQEAHALSGLRQQAFSQFTKLGIPNTRNEEWKYTRLDQLLNQDFQIALGTAVPGLQPADLDPLRLPGHAEANELVFVNGRYVAALSSIRSRSLNVLPLEEAATGQFKDIVAANLGQSGRYIPDGLNALNTSLSKDGLFIQVPRGKTLEHPLYIYQITDARSGNIFAMPRILVHIAAGATAQLVECHRTLGAAAGFTNAVLEMAVEAGADVRYCKIQNDAATASQVSTAHIRQLGKSLVNVVTISLNGDIVRNNLNLAMEAEYCEAHMYGLYFQRGSSHIDNHTVVDNIRPNCFSNELYKGVMDGQSTGVFNGKIYVQPDAQKTNAYQSNKNILLSRDSSVNTKPQLEIFADDVKCSHGCTVGQLDDEAMFYLQSRGIPVSRAKALLLQGFAVDVVEKISLSPIRAYVDQLISERLELM